MAGKHTGYEILSAAQARAGRALLGLPYESIAEDAEISVSSLRSIEAGRASPLRSTMVRLRRSLEERGVVFIAQAAVPPNDDEAFSGPGVRLRGK